MPPLSADNMAGRSQINGTTAILWRSSSDGANSPPVPPALGQLRACRGLWCPPVPWDRGSAHAILLGRPAGSFLVLSDSETSRPSLLCVSAGEDEAGVLDYPIRCIGSTVQLSHSHLDFGDLAQLVLFYSLTRDVLSVRLCIPSWIQSLMEESKAGPESWFCAPPDLQTEQMTTGELSTTMCSIQLTSATGALCIINPLYLHEHGDHWLARQPAAPKCSAELTSNRWRRRLSTSRPWPGAGLQPKRAISLEQESSTGAAEVPGLGRAQSVELPATKTPGAPTTPAAAVVLRRVSRDSPNIPWRSGSLSSSSSTTPSSPTALAVPAVEAQHLASPVAQSPHRVSWIEDGRPYSLLPPSSLELDSLSISSIEEEQEEQESLALGPTSHPLTAHRLADKVKNRLSAVGQVLGALVCPQKRLTNRVLELSERRGGVFAEATREFVETTQKGGVQPGGATGSDFLQEVRLSLTALRETLLDCPEIQSTLDSITDIPDWEIDSMVEMSLHKVALKPVSAHLYSSLQISRCHDGSLPSLQGNQRVLEGHGVEELGGSAGAGVLDGPALERTLQRWNSMHAAYSPCKKVHILLKICKSIYHSMSTNASPGSVFGADDFLPCLTWVLLRSNVVTLQLDTDYMMELLDPSQLQGEGGYYLTSLYASLYYISSFRPRLAVRQLSVEAHQSLKQWHRRRTLYCNQSRRTAHRRTIRRQANQASREEEGKNPEVDPESDCGGGVEGEAVDARQSTPSSEGAESEQLAAGDAGGEAGALDQSELSTVEKEEEQGRSTQHREEKEDEGERHHSHRHDVLWTSHSENQ